MSIFPETTTLEESSVTVGNESTVHRTYAFDVEKGEFLLQPNGEPVVLEGLDALRQQVQMALITERYTYPIYSSDYGNELKELIRSEGTREWKQAEAERLVKEAVEYLLGVELCQDFTFAWQDNSLHIEFVVVTEEGIFTEEVTV